MAKFDFKTYINCPPKSVEWFSDDEFEIVVGTKRVFHNDIMDKAGQYILKNVKFHLKKNDAVCKATTLKGEDVIYLSDEEEMKLNIVLNNIEMFFLNYDFSPESFCSFVRYLMRPLSRTDKLLSRTKNKLLKYYDYA